MMRERKLNLAKLKSRAAESYSFGLMSLGLILSFESVWIRLNLMSAFCLAFFILFFSAALFDQVNRE